MKKVKNGKILMVRMDKIGDLVLTLPTDQLEALKGRDIQWWVSQGTGFIPRNSEPPRAYTEWPNLWSWRILISAIRWVKREQISTAIVYYAPSWVGLALWLARVPTRVGRLSQWHSFLFFNLGVRQSRSQSEMHESDYNLELVTRGLRLPPQVKIEPLRLKAPATDLSQLNLTNRYVVVHPGMAGSALNWPVSHYAELIRKLTEHMQVVITGTALDRPFVEPLRSELSSNARITWLNEQLSVDSLLGVLSMAQAVVAPSTGVLHLAASLGTKAVGLYSPLKAHHPNRWGPRGSQVCALVPGENSEALGDAQIMNGLSVETVLLALHNWCVIHD